MSCLIPVDCCSPLARARPCRSEAPSALSTWSSARGIASQSASAISADEARGSGARARRRAGRGAARSPRCPGRIAAAMMKPRNRSASDQPAASRARARGRRSRRRRASRRRSGGRFSCARTCTVRPGERTVEPQGAIRTRVRASTMALSMAADELIVHGAREHNLKDITVRLPRNALICITGLSGSGKSSLAFDTIYAEGQRRYVESPQRVRAPVPADDGEAGRRLDRRASARRSRSTRRRRRATRARRSAR